MRLGSFGCWLTASENLGYVCLAVIGGTAGGSGEASLFLNRYHQLGRAWPLGRKNPHAGRWTMQRLVRDIIKIKGENGGIPFRELHRELRRKGYQFTQRGFYKMFVGLRLTMDEDSKTVRAL